MPASFFLFKRPQKTKKAALFSAIGLTSADHRLSPGYFVGDWESSTKVGSLLGRAPRTGARNSELKVEQRLMGGGKSDNLPRETKTLEGGKE